MEPKIERFPILDSEVRECKVCKIPKQLNLEFRYHSTHETYSHCCKDCENKRKRLKYAGLPEPEEYKNLSKRVKQRRIFENKPYRKTSQYNRKRIDYKAVDKKKGRNSDLTTEFIEKCFNSNCVYCGFPAITLDRIDNTLGHTMDNCVPACFECNTARNRLFSYEEMKIIGKCIRSIKLDRGSDYIPTKAILPRFNKN